MIRILCLLAFVCINVPPVALAHDHKHHAPPPPTPTPEPVPVPADTGGGGHKKHKTLKRLLGAGAVGYAGYQIGYRWGKGSNKGFDYGVKLKETP